MTPRVALLLAAAVVLAGCRAREITSLERMEAANMVSEADFAVTLRDWPRAEGLFTKAAETCPDEGDIWINLGIVRMRMHNPDGARYAYKAALADYRDDFKKDSSDSVPVIRQAYLLVILGRPDDAHSLIDKTYAKYPDNRRLKNFVEVGGLDKIIADPGLKEISP